MLFKLLSVDRHKFSSSKVRDSYNLRSNSQKEQTILLFVGWFFTDAYTKCLEQFLAYNSGT